MGYSVPLQVNIQGNSHSGTMFFVIFPVIVYVAIHDEIYLPCHSFLKFLKFFKIYNIKICSQSVKVFLKFEMLRLYHALNAEKSFRSLLVDSASQ